MAKVFISTHKLLNLYFAEEIKIVESLNFWVKYRKIKVCDKFTQCFKILLCSNFSFSSISFAMLVVVWRWQCIFLWIIECLCNVNKIFVSSEEVHQCFLQISHRPLRWQLIRCILISFLVFLSITSEFCHVTLGSLWKEQINTFCFSLITIN